MGRQRLAAWVPGSVVRVTWKELAAIAQIGFTYDREPERVRQILGEPRTARVLSECRAHLHPQLVPVPEGEEL